MVQNEHEHAVEGSAVAESIEWFAGPERPVSGTISVIESDVGNNDRDI